MCRIKVKNFGPVLEGMEHDKWIELNKVTVFIGSQGSGKSTLAKLVSTFSWMEKVLARGDYALQYFVEQHRFRRQCCAFHRIEDFFQESSYIEYEGARYHFVYENSTLTISPSSSVSTAKQGLAQVLYVPAERNFISNIQSFNGFKNLSPAFASFIDDFQLVKESIIESIQLPINAASVEYDSLHDIFHIKTEGYKVRLSAASSGFQSLTPLFLTSRYFAQKVHDSANQQSEMDATQRARFKKAVEQIWADDAMSEEQKSAAISVIAKDFSSTSFINIVEEPEQNLYPLSQREILHSLLEFNNKLEENQLIITTHSPYIINYLTIAALASQVKQDKYDELREIISPSATIPADQVSIYVCHDIDGSIRQLPPYEGFPSSDHALNEMLGESNDQFSDILSLISP